MATKANTPRPAEVGALLHPAPALLETLTSPRLDRIVAALVCLPWIWFIFQLYQRRSGLLTWQLIFLEAEYVLIVLTTILRRPPKRVTANPILWLLGFVATYWGLMVWGFVQPGRPLSSSRISDALTVCGGLMVAWARISLGRNIGYVPAQRELVLRGAYRIVRHPIYAGIFVTYLGEILRLFTPRNALLFALGCAWFVLQSLVEENFLKADPQYSAYMRKVRARWIPLVI
jgi:protein-S-isoprenylcysteine O-methyltransferase Ste14